MEFNGRAFNGSFQFAFNKELKFKKAYAKEILSVFWKSETSSSLQKPFSVFDAFKYLHS